MATRLIQSSGKVTFLQVRDAPSTFGPNDDQISAEVIIRIDTQPDRAMGFQLRDNSDRPARQGMLDLLRDALNNDLTVVAEYSIDLDAGKTNGVLERVALRR